MEAESTEPGTAARRRFLAGAAGLAAGAAVLGSATEASASGPPTTIVDQDMHTALQWIDLSTGTLTQVQLGSDGVCRMDFSAMGDMAAMAIRIKVGTSGTIDTGTGPWIIDGSDMPTGFQPYAAPSYITSVGTLAWAGTGIVVGLGRPNQNQYALECGWKDWTAAGNGTMLTWDVADRYNDGMGNVMLNADGAVPFGNNLGSGDIVYGNLVYHRDTSED